MQDSCALVSVCAGHTDADFGAVHSCCVPSLVAQAALTVGTAALVCEAPTNWYGMQGCTLYSNWWPMLTLFFYVLIPMPYLFFGAAPTDSFYSSGVEVGYALFAPTLHRREEAQNLSEEILYVYDMSMAWPFLLFWGLLFRRCCACVAEHVSCIKSCKCRILAPHRHYPLLRHRWVQVGRATVERGLNSACTDL